MAKKKQDESQEQKAVAEAPADQQEQAIESSAAEVPAGLPPSTWRVSLQAATPLAFESLDVQADTQEDAREAFNKANGISGSVHPYNITKLS